MIVALTGTPGVGKSEVAEILRKKYKVVSVSELAERLGCILGEENGSKIVDVDLLSAKIDRSESVILEGHLSHHLNPDVVIVLRCNPKVLKLRLSKRGWGQEKILENVEAELTDVILMESMGCKNVYEIDTTELRAEDVADAVERILKGDVEDFKPGKIDWIFEVGDDIIDLMRF